MTAFKSLRLDVLSFIGRNPRCTIADVHERVASHTSRSAFTKYIAELETAGQIEVTMEDGSPYIPGKRHPKHLRLPHAPWERVAPKTAATNVQTTAPKTAATNAQTTTQWLTTSQKEKPMDPRPDVEGALALIPSLDLAVLCRLASEHPDMFLPEVHVAITTEIVERWLTEQMDAKERS